MKCPECHSPYNRIYDSRWLDDARKVRRRECLDCGCRFRTIEILADIIRANANRGRQKGER